MKHALPLLVALCCANSGLEAAEKPPVTKFTAADAALRHVERSDSYDKGSFAKWVGKLSLTGKLVIEFDRGPPEETEADTAGIAVFEPDTKSRARLPAARNYYAAPVTAVWLGQSPIEILPTLLGKERALQVIRGKSPRYEFVVSIDLKAFSTSVECDHRSYSIEYSAIRLAQPTMVAATEAKNLGC